VIASFVWRTVLGVFLPGATRLGAAFIRDRWSMAIRSATSQEHVGIVDVQPGGSISWKKTRDHCSKEGIDDLKLLYLYNYRCALVKILQNFWFHYHFHIYYRHRLTVRGALFDPGLIIACPLFVAPRKSVNILLAGPIQLTDELVPAAGVRLLVPHVLPVRLRTAK